MCFCGVWEADTFIPLSRKNRPSLLKEPKARLQLFKKRVIYKIKNLVKYAYPQVFLAIDFLLIDIRPPVLLYSATMQKPL